MVKKIILYRHGERSDQAPPERKIPHDISYDPPLTDLGHHQAEKASIYLNSYLSNTSSIKLVSSPMLRCVQTLSHLSSKLQKKINLQNAFGEAFDKDYGDTYSRLYTRHCPNVFPVNAEVEDEETKFQPNRVEPLEECGERMKRVSELYFHAVEEDVLVVCTHLYVIWGLCLANGDGYSESNPEYTQICEYEYEDGRLRLIRSGYKEHLDS